MLFEEFSEAVAAAYGMNITQWKYTSAYGWTLRGCIKSVALINSIAFLDHGFCIDGIVVHDNDSLQKAITYVSSLYTDDFLFEYNEKIAKRNKEQAARSRRRVKREAEEREEFLKKIDADKLNRFKWEPKVPRQQLLRLFQSDAKMIEDVNLLDDVGLRLYMRCLQGRDERLLADQKKLKCHHCKTVLPYANNGLLECSCGYAYIFRDYIRSFNKNSMPSRSATPFFNDFIDKWPKAKDYAEKMRLIDWIIHQCHLNMLSGVKRHFAGINLIEGTKQQISELILDLAYN